MARPSDNTRKIDVLVIDDQSVMRALIRDFLQSSLTNLSIGEAPDGARGLKLMTEREPRVVLMDVNLPDANGIELTAKFKAVRPGTRIIIVTNLAGSAYVDVMGWDCYNDKAPQGIYERPRDIFGAAVRLSNKLGKRWGIAETGSPLVGADDGRQRAAWLRTLGKYAVLHHAQFATYFDIRWNVDYRLQDPDSVAAWRRVMHGAQG